MISISSFLLIQFITDNFIFHQFLFYIENNNTYTFMHTHIHTRSHTHTHTHTHKPKHACTQSQKKQIFQKHSTAFLQVYHFLFFIVHGRISHSPRVQWTCCKAGSEQRGRSKFRPATNLDLHRCARVKIKRVICKLTFTVTLVNKTASPLVAYFGLPSASISSGRPFRLKYRENIELHSTKSDRAGFLLGTRYPPQPIRATIAENFSSTASAFIVESIGNFVRGEEEIRHCMFSMLAILFASCFAIHTHRLTFACG